jgi:predicted SAM-dependent methyltransferase
VQRNWLKRTMSSGRLKQAIKWVLPTGVLLAIQSGRTTRRTNLRMRMIELNCKAMDAIRVNVGCGPNPTKGWINLDMSVQPGVMYWDCTKGLPFGDGVVEAIYSEHFFEHLDYEAEAKQFLRECLRCLKPRGVLRIVVPDAGAYLRLYRKGHWDDETIARRQLKKEGDKYRDPHLDRTYRTRMEFINAVFRQYGEHKYAYDTETLVLTLQDAGFSNVSETAYNVSSDPDMARDTPGRRTESLYVEGRKP